MADWYVSSVAWAAIPQFAVSHAYTVGNIIRALAAPATNQQHTFRCTTAGTSGTSEAGWGTGNNATTTQGGAVFTCVSGQSAYGWSAAAGTLYTFNNISDRTQVGDRVFLSSDHSENYSGSWSFNWANQAWGLVQIISVNRAGSVPPTGTDVLSGASIAAPAGQGMTLESFTDTLWHGVTFSAGGFNFNFNSAKTSYLKNCALVFYTNSGVHLGNGNPSRVILDNTTVQFAATNQGIGGNPSYTLDLVWLNTPSAIQGSTIPTALFSATGNSGINVSCRGVDLSPIVGTLCSAGNGLKVLLDSCKIAPGVLRYAAATATLDEVELVNCFDGTYVLNERYSQSGILTTDRSTYLTGGAQDDNGNYAFKIATNTQGNKFAVPLTSFGIDVENAATGLPKTASVEIISSSSLNTDDVQLLLEYMGTSGSSIASLTGSFPNVLTTPSALTSSTAAWTGASLAAPVTWNPGDKSAGITLSNNNLTAAQTSGSNGVRANIALPSGKYYFEFTIVANGGGTNVYGVASASAGLGSATTAQYAIVETAGPNNVYTNGSFQASLAGGGISVGSVYGVAIDVTNQLIWFRLGANTWNGSGTANPATGTGGFSFSSLTGAPYPFYGPGYSSDSATANFGATSYANAPPSGFVAPTITPVTQKLQVSFTQAVTGRIRGQVRLGKPSTTIWIDPRITVS